MFAKLKEKHFEMLTTEAGERYKVADADRSDIWSWQPGDSLEISGFGSDTTIRNTHRFKTVKASRW